MASHSTASSTILSSPTFTATSTSSFDMISPRSRPARSLLTTSDDSDDEIVWSVSSGYLSSDPSLESSVGTEEDFVVLRGPFPNPRTNLSTPSVNADRSRTPQSSDLVSDFANLSMQPSGPSLPHVRQKRGGKVSGSATIRQSAADLDASQNAPPAKSPRKKRQPARPAYSSPEPSSQPARPESVDTKDGKSTRRARRGKKRPTSPTTGLGARPIVDDVSEAIDGASVCDDESTAPTIYEEAGQYITSCVNVQRSYLCPQTDDYLSRFLSDPSQDSISHLTLLQALIIELGLATSSLPASLRAAKAVLKSSAFLNIRDYLAVREEGVGAIQRVMYPSRTALIKDIKRKRNPASLRWVKQSGLQVLLVSCYH